jgi:hypothetical protein
LSRAWQCALAPDSAPPEEKESEKPCLAALFVAEYRQRKFSELGRRNEQNQI